MISKKERLPLKEAPKPITAYLNDELMPFPVLQNLFTEAWTAYLLKNMRNGTYEEAYYNQLECAGNILSDLLYDAQRHHEQQE